MQDHSPGYSGTPLAKKLGLKEANRILLVAAPENYVEYLGPLPQAVQFETEPSPAIALAHVFVTQKEELSKQLSMLRKCLSPKAAIWVSWPKKSARVPTDITENTIRAVALPLGFVDIKVCAVTEVWSGLKLVVRKELR